MAYLILYKSNDSHSLAAAWTALNKYPTATLKDTAGLSLSTIGTYIGTLVAATYTKIINCCSERRVEAVASSGIITMTHGGTAGDVGAVTVKNGSDTFTIGSATSAAGTATAFAVLLKASVNAGTAVHGYSADNSSGELTVYAPTSLGKTVGDALELGIVIKGVNLAGTVTTDFAAAATGKSKRSLADPEVTA